jgi:hypothetical protein
MCSDGHGDRLAWARFNAYGILVAGLAIYALSDLFHPAGTDMARLIGEIPPGQYVWVTGFVISGLLMLHGFIRTDRTTETMALALLLLGLVAQGISAYAYLGITEFTATRIYLFVLVALVTWARCSVLWGKHGLVIRIPPRGETEGDR